MTMHKIPLTSEDQAIRDAAWRRAGDMGWRLDIDDRLDDHANELVAAVLTDPNAAERDPQESVQMALIGRFYERIGDHAVTMGEWVRFIVEGWDRAPTAARFSDLDGSADPAFADDEAK